MKTKRSKKPFQRHAPEFKADVVELVRSGGKTITEAARDLGLAHSLIRGWVAKAEAQGAGVATPALSASEKEELTHLRREVKTLRMEREILKRAATFFAKESA
jgi:transposase